MEIDLAVRPRTEMGKGPSGRYRAAGLVPAIFYGSSVDPVALVVDAKEMDQALHTEAGANVLINLKVNGNSHLTVPREVQRHPIKGTLTHVDFVNVSRDRTISAEVPVHLVGESPGVKEGGVVEQHIYELDVEALPSDVPSSIEVDISVVGMNESLKVEDLTVHPAVTVITPADEVVVSVGEPKGRAEEEIEEVDLEAGEEGAVELGEDDESQEA